MLFGIDTDTLPILQMFPYRMAREPSSLFPFLRLILLLLCVTSAASAAASTTVSLSSDFSSIIPSCAQECFLSFVAVNYPDIDDECGSTPSLQCLCSRAGASGFTIGEGAVQCITAEKAIGFCSRLEASGKLFSSTSNNKMTMSWGLKSVIQIPSSARPTGCVLDNRVQYSPHTAS